ncbi:hypothetical protein PHYBOEH_004780 [Phytophthora boehmeriae]|uniref:BZIP domain-containing protein n=1 Tax=Phytophthora boehmeriae TaxID=109152 RepID=A0A8T1WS44_9STRA|nr:hypothetical protein PHYBOEH_004780 [Phytophthora boehmeriae]
MKVQQRETNKAKYCKQKRQGGANLPPQLLSSLGSAQAAGLPLSDYKTFQKSSDQLKSLTGLLPSEEIQMLLVAEWNKAQRKEQCRQAQLKCQKRKREELQGLIDDMTALNREIKQLEDLNANIKKEHAQFVQIVVGFYSSLQIDIDQQQPLPDVRNYERTYGCSPALQEPSDLQREEFDSMESLKLHWHWYHSQFWEFKLLMTSYDCLEAGEHVIVKAAGNLVLVITPHDKQKKEKPQIIECSILQHFEFENGKRIVKRITSEVDLVGGVTRTQGSVDPERILSILYCFSKDFCSSNCNVDS